MAVGRSDWGPSLCALALAKGAIVTSASLRPRPDAETPTPVGDDEAAPDPEPREDPSD